MVEELLSGDIVQPNARSEPDSSVVEAIEVDGSQSPALPSCVAGGPSRAAGSLESPLSSGAGEQFPGPTSESPLDDYPIPSAPTTCSWYPEIRRQNWRFGQVDPASERRYPARGRITAWCVGC